jgi:hypothetical protein
LEGAVFVAGARAGFFEGSCLAEGLGFEFAAAARRSVEGLIVRWL